MCISWRWFVDRINYQTQISWGQTTDPGDWGVQWIKDHATSMTNAKKPVILEEFGVTTNQTAVYTSWYSTIISSGLTGDLIWCAISYNINIIYAIDESHLLGKRVLTFPAGTHRMMAMR